ncbi:unnamed protein product [Ectocarpus sp. CCAP 1310/34]|nr:unnamed protein product [Ectocarpus sp. CCAP 1310/34]
MAGAPGLAEGAALSTAVSGKRVVTPGGRDFPAAAAGETAEQQIRVSGASASAEAPAARGGPTGSHMLPATPAVGTAGVQALAARVVPSVAAPAARMMTRGGRVFPAVAAAGETAGQQALVAGAAASAAAPVARGGTTGSHVLPATPAVGTAGVQALAARAHRWREEGPPAVMCSPRHRPSGRSGYKHSQLGRYHRNTGGESGDPRRQGFPPAAAGETAGQQALVAGAVTSAATPAARGGQPAVMCSPRRRPAGTHALTNGAAAPPLMGAATTGEVTVTVATEGGLGYRTP